MDKRLPSTSSTPEITLDIAGNLTVKGWDKWEIVARCQEEEDLSLEQSGETIAIRCQGDCSAHVPYGSSLQVKRASGHATLRSLEGDLAMREISGHLELLGVGLVTIERVRGHLSARNISRDLVVRTIEGNATVRDVQGDFTVHDAVQGNLTLDNIGGTASVTARGNIEISLDPTPGNSYRFEADGNLHCHIPREASVKIDIQQASQVRVKIPDLQIPAPIRTPFSLTLGEGDAVMVLSAHGNLTISNLSSGWGMEDIEVGEDFDQVAEAIESQFTDQIGAQMEMLEQQIEAQLENLSREFTTAGLSAEQSERLNQRAREASERANARAQEKIARAQERLQRKLEVARRRAEMRTRAAERAARDRRKRAVPFGWSPPEAERPAESVSDAERLMILQMLEQQKITIEEAEQLMAALEGKGL